MIVNMLATWGVSRHDETGPEPFREEPLEKEKSGEITGQEE